MRPVVRIITLLFAVMLVAACGQSLPTPSATASPAASVQIASPSASTEGTIPSATAEIPIATANAPSDICLTASIRGKLVADARWGVGLQHEPGLPVVKLIFPFGYRAFATQPRISIVDAEGRVVAHEGDHIMGPGGVGGGLGADEVDGICPFKLV
jgi:hypothetical protein